MHRHQHFDLWLHDDEELVPLVQSDVHERKTLHEWPLSCVQRLALADGRKLIYKTQFGPTVEPEVYAIARSDLLPCAQTIYQSDDHVCMLIEFIDGPRIQDLHLSEEEVVRIGRAVISRIATQTTPNAGAPPCYLDVSDEKKWKAHISAMLKGLRDLIDRGKFRLVKEVTVRDLEHWATSESVLSVIRAEPGYVHGDLGGDNLFVLVQGYRVIDWQRPILGPSNIDLAILLESLGFDPVPYVGEGVVRVHKLLTAHWLTECAVTWFPEGIPGYDEQIAQLASQMAS